MRDTYIYSYRNVPSGKGALESGVQYIAIFRTQNRNRLNFFQQRCIGFFVCRVRVYKIANTTFESQYMQIAIFPIYNASL